MYLITFKVHTQSALLKGVILDEEKKPVPGASIRYNKDGTLSDNNGVYELLVPANQEIKVSISYLGFKNVVFKIALEENQVYELNPVLKTDIEQISEVIISGREKKTVEGITTLDPETIRLTPSANPGVEGLLKTLPGVSSNNELSTQYSVRGGNFDENLVYVNEIEVYRPFLIRSGQQEGLSFVNTDLVRSVDFSAGGFQAKYGDKLSSVLDITYRRPTGFGATANIGMLVGTRPSSGNSNRDGIITGLGNVFVSAEGISKDKKLAAILGVRFRDNSIIVKSRPTDVNFRPTFGDIQTYISYNFSNKFELGFLGNLAINRYNFQPIQSFINFGNLQSNQQLRVIYEGEEIDRYDTYFGALKGTYKPTEHTTLRFIGSAYQTQEQEYYDILANYALGDVNNDIGSENVGEVEFFRGAGSQFIHARNDLDAIIINAEHKGTYNKDEHQVDWGIKYTKEDILDRLQEYEIIDSLGFSIRPPFSEFVNDQPYNPNVSPIVPFNSVRALNEVKIDRVSGFGQYSIRTQWKEHELWANFGVRGHYWNVHGKNISSSASVKISPRMQVALKPDWEKTDMIFRLSGGWYHQPPFYRELRDSTGTVQPDVKAQQSVHIVLGNDYSFLLKKRPFTLTSEIYYKYLTDVNPYTIENVRIRYEAANNAKAYAYGVDVRLTGDFVPGAESWLSVGYLKTEENIEDRGFISRPTDQRFKVGLLFQDYVPTIPNLKAYLNLLFQTGVPGGTPNYADPYTENSEGENFRDQRLRDYHRADLGISYIFIDEEKKKVESGLFSSFKSLSLGLEVFNIFNRQNAITNTFVRDASSGLQFAVPNFLSPRVLNVKLAMKF
ncbi:TonB-dependent receptor [Aquimarina sp. ERC-38]|nr:carboxypeptidase-like regulatory domain-containing protein [Aquimarina sp. ERC-38]UZO82680.1 TonB-dependent receptor [Aquimarina sp. ERC-38]